MSTIAAQVKAQSGGRYVKQLASHWKHKFDVALEGETARIPFPTAVATLAGNADGIAIEITGEDRDDLERLTDVVSKHIDRFAFREAPLAYEWHWRDEVA